MALLALAPASGYVARAPLSARPRRTQRVAPSMALITGSPFRIRWETDRVGNATAFGWLNGAEIAYLSTFKLRRGE